MNDSRSKLVVRVITIMAIIQLIVGFCSIGFFLFAVNSFFNLAEPTVSGGRNPTVTTNLGFEKLGVAANFLTAISVAVGAFGAIGTLLFSIAPAILSQFGFGPSLDLEFANAEEFIHSWETETAGEKSVFIRFAVKNNGFIGAEAVECLVESIKKGDTHYDRIPERLRWAHSWRKRLEEIKPGESDRNDDLPKSISPQSRAFIDFGFILSSSSKFYSEKLAKISGLSERSRTQIEEPNFWCLHLADRWIPSESAILKPELEGIGEAKFVIKLCIVAKNSHKECRNIEVTIRQKELKPEYFDEKKVVGTKNEVVTIFISRS